jgi:Ca2+-binding RTX toxin-like protein
MDKTGRESAASNAAAVAVSEHLEQRRLMSAAPAGSTEELLALDGGAGIWRVGAGVLVIRGTRAKDVIEFHDHWQGNPADFHYFLRVTLNGHEREFIVDDVAHLRINVRGGDDVVYMTRFAPPRLTVEDHEIAIAGRVRGGPGNDTIRGGSRDDTIDGGEGNDWIAGEHGDDLLLGGPGDDAIHAKVGDDTIHGHAGDDWLDGDVGGDVLSGGAGNDRISNRGADYGPDDRDWIYGGGGRDRAQTDPRDLFKDIEERTDAFFP